ncbi:MAG TPA: glycosyltransferase family 4 protein [Gemmatimonadaceae bacterium]|nr:glycosyltransferase family 4 protein [Gemmatimonadaceae bacterium]
MSAARGPAWVLVAGGFHQRGGMDKANAALADLLSERGCRVELVAHHFDPEYADERRFVPHAVPRPAGSFLLGELLLERRGRAVAAAASARPGGARVVVNGGNCLWDDVNWVHSVHHAWPAFDAGAPLWFRAKNRGVKAWARRRERAAITAARVVVVNSERTRRDVVEHLGVDPARTRLVYLGADPDWGAPSPDERAAARAWIGAAPGQPVVAFVGALSHDRNKGLDTLWRAWTALSTAGGGWDALLVVAGGGSGVAGWQAAADAAGLRDRVRFLGFTPRVRELLAAADLLVSPARYEAYGLNVQEAVCRGVPAIVSATAGIAERYPAELSPMVLADPEDARELAVRLLAWRERAAEWRRRFEPFAGELRAYGWRDMAADFVDAVSPDVGGAAERGERAAAGAAR